MFFVLISSCLLLLTTAERTHIDRFDEKRRGKLIRPPRTRPLQREDFIKKPKWKAPKIVKSVVKTVDKAATDTHKWGKKAVKTVDTHAKKFGKTIESAAKDTAKWVEKAGKDVAKWSKEAIEDAAEWTKNAVDDIIDLIECVAGVDLGCIGEIHEQNMQCITKGECVFEYGDKCLKIPRQSIRIDKTLFQKDWGNRGVELKFSGSLDIDLGMKVAIDPSDFKFELEVVAEVKNTLNMKLSASGSYEKKIEKDLGDNKQLFKKVFMAGKVPILVEVHMAPKAWIDVSTKANFDANIELTGGMTYSQKSSVDIDDGKVSPFNGKFTGKPYSIQDLTVEGKLNADASIRVGPHITVSVNKVPVSIDVAAKLGASLSLEASYKRKALRLLEHRSIQKQNFIERAKLPENNAQLQLVPRKKEDSLREARGICFKGSISLEAAADVRIGLKASALNPIDLARQACEEAAAMLTKQMNPIYHLAKTASCFADAIGVDIKKVTDKVGAIDAFVSTICGKAIDFLVPDELQKFACKATHALNAFTDWATIVSIKPAFNVGLCSGTGLTHSHDLKVESAAKLLTCGDAGGAVVNKAPTTYVANWWSCFDRQGWCQVSKGYMTGLYRNTHAGSNDKIILIEQAESKDAPSNLQGGETCRTENWSSSFDKKGWSLCKHGYYMKGLYRSSSHWLYNIENAKCCRPKKVTKWGSCKIKGVWSSFDNKGWSKCDSGYYMTGLYRNSCHQLYCLEQFYCCKM